MILLPVTAPLKSISPALKVSGLLPAAKVEPKEIVAVPRLNVVFPIRVTGALNLMSSSVVVKLPEMETEPVPSWVKAPSRMKLSAAKVKNFVLVRVTLPLLVVVTVLFKLRFPVALMSIFPAIFVVELISTF